MKWHCDKIWCWRFTWNKDIRNYVLGLVVFQVAVFGAGVGGLLNGHSTYSEAAERTEWCAPV